MTDNFERALEERLHARSQVSSRDVEALRLFTRTLPARRGFSLWPRLFQVGAAAAAVVLAAVVAFGALTRIGGVGNNPSPSPTYPAIGPAPSPLVPEPTIAPEPTAVPPVVQPSPTQVPIVGIGTIRLAVASGSVVNVTIDDPSGLVAGAVAEQAKAGMSFAWGNSSVESVTPRSIRVTWVGYPRDEDVALAVSRNDSGGIHLAFVQDAPVPNSDGEGEDRVIVLTFNENVDPADFVVTFTDPS